MDGAFIQWLCEKQTGVSLSTMEAEFTSTSHVVRELIGFHEVFSEIGFKVAKLRKMMMDNEAVIRQLESEDSMSSAKHVNIQVKFMRYFAKLRLVKIEYVEGHMMKADLLTKAHHASRMTELSETFSSNYLGNGHVRGAE
uniref:AlNc14C205G8781 protein n=1 Tax=Albugo laibachii Nc14 TaxID=890382 RepID=F0WQX1_9STRA|nr:AlNc14C205G8781 [Albugo laibachii Nc14]|eukprot:CCA23731.1 AlNc14C205G8781 [Albugo laibachii Nc14]